MAIKRLRYFDNQFLVEADFTAEQKYHLDMRRRLNRALHTFGIAEGLEVVKKTNKIVIVKPGVAIDRDGREIIVEKDEEIPLPAQVPANATIFIAIAYQEQKTDPSKAGAPGDTRVTERFIALEAVTTAPPTDGTVVRLASFKLDGSANVPGNVNDTFDGGVRQTVSPKGAASLDGVSNPGGNIDLVQAQTIVITPDDANNRITIGESHSTRANNPHNVTAAQIGALVSVAGVSNPGGSIELIPANAIAITPDDATNRITIGENHSARTDNPHTTTAAQVGALPTTGGGIVGSIFVDRVFIPSNDSGFKSVVGLKARFLAEGGGGGAPFPFNIPRAAVAAESFVSGITGLQTFAPDGTVALLVAGTAQFTGAKTGYVVDTFLNASGQKLRIGDVVKLKGTPITRFQGDANKIPVPEVALADKENDTKVIGIVDREAIPEQDVPDTRVGPEDPTFIENGGELFVVTLGTYAHCKVDATEAPIEVGDLLTSSSNPGHAKKATDPKIGSIIGKALEPLEEGTGYIALFVNIQ